MIIMIWLIMCNNDNNNNNNDNDNDNNSNNEIKWIKLMIMK